MEILLKTNLEEKFLGIDELKVNLCPNDVFTKNCCPAETTLSCDLQMANTATMEDFIVSNSILCHFFNYLVLPR